MTQSFYAAPTTMFKLNYWIMPVISKRDATVSDVIDATCVVFDVLKVQLVSKTRQHEITRARFICMYVMKKMIKGLSLKKIGEQFNRDHTTVMHAINAINDELSTQHTKDKCIDDINRVIALLV